MNRIEIEEVEGVEPPRRARVEEAVETAAEKLERKRDYLEGFLAEKPAAAAPGVPGGDIYEGVVAALKEIFRLTQGYPYFIQEWGYQSWNRAAGPPITLEVVKAATATVIERLDANFFRVRFDRLTPGEKRFLRAMAGLGAGAHRSADIAEALGVNINSLGPGRAKLIQKGMIYSPTHGDLAFTVPLFDEFMLRAMPQS